MAGAYLGKRKEINMFYQELWDDENPASHIIPVTVKLTRQQVEAIEASGEARSQWISAAVDERLAREGIPGG